MTLNYVGVDKGALQMIVNALERDAATLPVRAEMMEALRETMQEVPQPKELQKWMDAVFDNTQPMGNRLQVLATGLSPYAKQPKVIGPSFKEITSTFQRPVTLKITTEADGCVTVDLITMGRAPNDVQNLCLRLYKEDATHVISKWTKLLGLDPSGFVWQALSK